MTDIKKRPAWPLTALTLTAGLCTYLLLIVLILGNNMNPLAPQWPWQLAFEHSELEILHYADALGLLIAAFPLALAFLLLRIRHALVLLALVATLAALPYALTPQPFYAEEQTWLLQYSVTIEAAKIVLAPLLDYSLLVLAVRAFGRLRKHRFDRL